MIVNIFSIRNEAVYPDRKKYFYSEIPQFVKNGYPELYRRVALRILGQNSYMALLRQKQSAIEDVEIADELIIIK